MTLPHEQIIPSGTNTDEETGNHDGAWAGKASSKEDVYIEYPQDIDCDRSDRADTPDNIVELGEKNDLHSPKICPICMESYTDGDDIVWSFNEECNHVFHRECIVCWLMKHDDCPMCRSPYIVDADVDSDKSTSMELYSSRIIQSRRMM